MSPIPLLAPARLALQQAERPQLDASVDEDRVSVGEELTYTLRAVSHSPVPMQVTLAPFNGLEVVGRERGTEVGFGDGPDPDDDARGPAARRAARTLADRAGRRVQGRDDRADAAPSWWTSPPTGRPPRRRSVPALRACWNGARATVAGGKPAVDLLVSADTVASASRWTSSRRPGFPATSGSSSGGRRRCSRR